MILFPGAKQYVHLIISQSYTCIPARLAGKPYTEICKLGEAAARRRHLVVCLMSGKWIKKENDMLRYALIFLVVALLAAFLGFGGIAGAAAGIARILFYIFIAFFLISIIANFLRRA